MNRFPYRKLVSFVIIGMCVIPCISNHSIAHTGDPDKDNVLGYVLIPHLPRAIGRVEVAAARFNSESLKPGMLTMMLGALLGDSKFENLNTAKPVIAFFYKPSPGDKKNTPPLALFIPVKKSDRYVRALAILGMDTAVRNNIIIAAQGTENLAMAQQSLKRYRALAKTRIKADMRLSIDVARYTAIYDKQIDSALGGLREHFDRQVREKKDGSAIPDRQLEAMSSVFRFYLAAIIGLVRQSQSYLVDIAISAKAIQLDTRLAATPGSPLHALYSVATPEKNSVLRYVPAGGIIRGALRYDPARYVSFLRETAAAVIKQDPSLATLFNPELLSGIYLLESWWNGESSFSMGLTRGNRLAMYYVSTVKDEAAALAYMEKIPSLFFNSPLFKNLTGDSGFTIVFKKNIRRHHDIDIHGYEISPNTGRLPGKDAQSLHRLFGEKITYEFAVLKGYLAGSLDPGGLNTLIAAIANDRSGPGLRARNRFGGGKDLYIDYNIAELVRIQYRLQTLQGTVDPELVGLMKIIDRFPDSEKNIMITGATHGGESRGTYYIPLAVFAEMSKMMNRKKKAAEFNRRPAGFLLD